MTFAKDYNNKGIYYLFSFFLFFFYLFCWLYLSFILLIIFNLLFWSILFLLLYLLLLSFLLWVCHHLFINLSPGLVHLFCRVSLSFWQMLPLSPLRFFAQAPPGLPHWESSWDINKKNTLKKLYTIK